MKVLVALLLLCLAVLTGCSSGDSRAAELLDTARFEEKQGNLPHATQLYNEILSRHPSSAAAKDAASRLEELKNRPR